MNGKFGKFRGGTAGNELRADGFPGCTVNKPYNVLFIIVNREIDPVAVVFEFNIEYLGFAGFKLKIVLPAAAAAVVACDPNAVAGSGVRDAPIVNACGDIDFHHIIANDVFC